MARDPYEGMGKGGFSSLIPREPLRRSRRPLFGIQTSVPPGNPTSTAPGSPPGQGHGQGQGQGHGQGHGSGGGSSGGGPASGGPSTLTGLIGWWDLSVTAGITGNPNITAVADQSGAGNGLTTASGTFNSPLYSPNTFNNPGSANNPKPSMRYDSTAFSGLGKTVFPMGTGNTLTFFAAMIVNSGTYGIGTPARIFSYTAAGQTNDYDNIGSWCFTRDSSAGPKFAFSRNNTGLYMPGNYTEDAFIRLIFTMKSDGTWTFYLNGVANSAAGAAGAHAATGFFALGVSKNNSGSALQQLGGKFAEAGIATGWHDATRCASLDSYLQNKWA